MITTAIIVLTALVSVARSQDACTQYTQLSKDRCEQVNGGAQCKWLITTTASSSTPVPQCTDCSTFKCATVDLESYATENNCANGAIRTSCCSATCRPDENSSGGPNCPAGEEFDSIEEKCVAVSCESEKACKSSLSTTSVCKPAVINCIRAPCAQFTCEENSSGGSNCPSGEEFDSALGKCVAVSCESDNACKSSQSTRVCKPADITCFRAPCPQFTCEEVSSGGGSNCPAGEEFDDIQDECVAISCESEKACKSSLSTTSVCKPADITCIRAPCPQFTCEEDGLNNPCAGRDGSAEECTSADAQCKYIVDVVPFGSLRAQAAPKCEQCLVRCATPDLEAYAREHCKGGKAVHTDCCKVACDPALPPDVGNDVECSANSSEESCSDDSRCKWIVGAGSDRPSLLAGDRCQDCSMLKCASVDLEAYGRANCVGGLAQYASCCSAFCPQGKLDEVDPFAGKSCAGMKVTPNGCLQPSNYLSCRKAEARCPGNVQIAESLPCQFGCEREEPVPCSNYGIDACPTGRCRVFAGTRCISGTFLKLPPVDSGVTDEQIVDAITAKFPGTELTVETAEDGSRYLVASAVTDESTDAELDQASDELEQWSEALNEANILASVELAIVGEVPNGDEDDEDDSACMLVASLLPLSLLALL